MENEIHSSKAHVAWKDSWLSAIWEHAAPSHSAPDDTQVHPGLAQTQDQESSERKLFWKRHSSPITLKYKNMSFFSLKIMLI